MSGGSCVLATAAVKAKATAKTGSGTVKTAPWVSSNGSVVNTDTLSGVTGSKTGYHKFGNSREIASTDGHNG
ncbi:MAG: hypothetical protein LBK95_19600 [Bifidobacteriaceae bacterium]|nr:hypothetical protein [Bifidobacteriaceae bacterium]